MNNKIPKTEEQKRLDNIRRNKEMRLRKGLEINQARKDKRNALKAITNVKIEISTPILKKATKLPQQSKVIKQDNTKKTYISFIRTFYKSYSNQELPDNADIIKKINEEPYKALAVSKQFKTIITANIKEIIKNPHQVRNLRCILSGIRGFTDILKQLEPYLHHYQQIYQEQRSIIEADPVDLKRIDFDNIADIQANIEKLDNRIDKIIYSYAMVIKRRPSDLRLTKIANSKEDLQDLNSNWLFKNKLYINQTKNKVKIVIDLPEILNFWNNTNDTEIQPEYLLGRLIPASSLSQMFQRIFLTLTGKIYNANQLRHINASVINSKGLSLQERKASATASGHSVLESIAYAYRNNKE